MVEKEAMNIDNNIRQKEGVNRNARIIVRNVSFKATDDSLREHFAPYGDLKEVSLLKKPDGKLVGCAFVQYAEVDMANKAIAATNKKPFLGRPVYVSMAVAKHMYNNKDEGGRIRNHSMTSEDDKDNIKKNKEDGIKDIKEKKDKVRVNRNARLIIRNVSFKATEESLKQHFEPYGAIHEVTLLKKPDGKLVGCGFVHFKNVPMAKKALLSTNMKPFLGRPISVDWAVAKNQYMQHKVSQQIELEDQVKKEDSDNDDDDKPPLNISNDELKAEIKSESDDDNSESDNEESENESDMSDHDSGDDDERSEDENDDEDDMDDDKSVTSSVPERRKLNDAEDGCTVFITNIPFSIDDDQLKEFVEKVAPVRYALVCVDKLSEHSKGSGFVKFTSIDDADKFLSLTPEQLKLEGQTLIVKPALKRENLDKGSKSQAKDNRNLYLVKEGVIVAGTKAAVGVSASDMAKRLTLERSKTQMLKDLNRFVSRYRLVVANLPPNCTDARLRAICSKAVGRKATITEARVMRDLRAPIDAQGKHPSKGFGFVMFMRHEDALTCLRKLNNNPDIFDKNNRPIVSFSIEDRKALNARKKRLEKSVANNPVTKKEENNENKKRNRKRKQKMQPDESYAKKQKNSKEKQNGPSKVENGDENTEVGKFVRRPPDDDDEKQEFAGLTAKKGSQHKMRSNFKLRTQAEIHRQTLKIDKKKSKKAMKLKKLTKERVKLPKQKMNKSNVKNKNKRRFKDKSVF